MRRPNGEWTTELGRQNGYQNGPDLPANAQKAITLQMYARDGQIRGRYSLDDGADLDRDRRRLPARRARRTPGIGVAAYNGTGSEVGTFEAFTVGEPPELPPTPPCETPPRPEAGYTMLFNGTDASLDELEVLRRRALRARRLHDQVRRRVRPAVHQAGLRGAVLAQARVDDARGRQLRRLRRLPRHRGEHGRHLDLARARRSRSTRRTTRPRPRARSTSSRRRTPPPATRSSSRAGQWNAYEIVVRDDRIIVFLNGVEDQRVDRRRPERRPRHGPHRPADARGGRRRVLPQHPRPRARGERGRARHGRRDGAGDAVADAGRAGVVRDVHARRGPDLRGRHDGHRDQHGG